MATTLIGTNMSAIRSHNMLEKNNANMEKAMQRVNTTMRINSVQDSPSKWAVSEKMRERINSLNQASDNVQNDTNMMKTAEQGINSTVEILTSIKASVLQALDDHANDDDRRNILKEINSLFEQIDQTAKSMRYNGKLLLTTTATNQPDNGTANSASGDDVSLQFQVGDDTNGLITGVSIQNMTLRGLDLASYSAAIVSAAGSASAAGSYFSTSGETLRTAIENALQTALDAAVDVGNWEKRLGYTADNVATQIENVEASDSVIRDADMAKEISNFMKWQVASQASQYMLAQSNQNAYQVLSLLQ